MWHLWICRCKIVSVVGSPCLQCTGVLLWGQLDSGDTLMSCCAQRSLHEPSFSESQEKPWLWFHCMSPVWNQIAIFTGDMLRTALLLWPLPWAQGPSNLLWGDNKGCSFAPCPSHASLFGHAATLVPEKSEAIPCAFCWCLEHIFSWFDLGENGSKNVTGWVLNCTLCHERLSKLSRHDQHVCGQDQQRLLMMWLLWPHPLPPRPGLLWASGGKEKYVVPSSEVDGMRFSVINHMCYFLSKSCST